MITKCLAKGWTKVRVLENLEPKSVFRFFEDLTRIPHDSGNERT